MARRDVAPDHEPDGCADAALSLPSISHILGLGQSNEQGAQSEPVVSGADLGFGALMFDRGIQTRSQAGVPPAPGMCAGFGSTLAPLMPVADEPWAGESPAVGMISQLLRGANHTAEVSVTTPKFLYSYPHMGGKHLAELDWRDYETHPANPNPGPGGYHATFVDDIRRAKAAAEAAGLTYGVFAFHLTQGENEGIGYLLPGGAVLTHEAFVPAYKADLAVAHARWDFDARVVTGQRRPIPLFISQVDNWWAGQAQAQLANESPNAFVVGPIYYVPSALNSLWNGTMRGHRAHLSADGQRWRGEQVGKVMCRVLFEREDWRPLQPRDIRRVSDTTIVVAFDVPRPPLVFETEWLPRAPDFGFEVHLGSRDTPGLRRVIADLAITGPDEVTITLDAQTPFPEGAIGFVAYGQALTVGVTSCPVAAIRPGERYDHGAASTELVFAGDLRAAFGPLLVEGCFILRQLVKAQSANDFAPYGLQVGPSASIVVRDMRLEGETTIVRGETDSIEGTLVCGDICSIERDRPFGNIRDSDTAQSNFSFADPTYGSRYGQSYPLHNFCLVFSAEVQSKKADRQD